MHKIHIYKNLNYHTSWYENADKNYKKVASEKSEE